MSKYVNAIETADIDLRNSKSTPRKPMERPFGNALEKAKLRAAEIKAMRQIGEALNSPEGPQSSMSTP